MLKPSWMAVLLLAALAPASVQGDGSGNPFDGRDARCDQTRDAEWLLAELRESGQVVFGPYLLVVRDLKGRELQDPLLKRVNAGGVVGVIMQARSARLQYSPAERMLVIHLYSGKALWEDGSTSAFLYFP